MMSAKKPRKPAAFSVEEVEIAEPDFDRLRPAVETSETAAPAPEPPAKPPLVTRLHHGLRWGTLLVSAALALASLAFTLWFTRFVSIALARDDWIGWTASALLAIIAVSGAVILLREIVGFFRLARLGRLKEQAARALREGDIPLERAAASRIITILTDRVELQWNVARMRQHMSDVRDPGDLLRLTDRELLAPLDVHARRLVARAARRVSVATAISPFALFSVSWVLVENMRLLRALATLYGGRPGFAGTVRLGRMVFTHIIATGGIAMTDDLFGQFLGQDLLRRLSRRLGEGIFNGALTARIGAAAIHVARPLPFLEARPVRARDFLTELLKGAEDGRADSRRA